MPISQLDQQLLDAAKKGRKEFDELYGKIQNDFNTTYKNINSYDFTSALQDPNKVVDYGGGYKVKYGGVTAPPTGKQGGSQWDLIDLVAPDGTITQIRHTDRKSTAAQIKNAITSKFGTGLLNSNRFNDRMSYLGNIASQAGDTTFNTKGVKGYWDEQYRDWRNKRDSQNYGTFIAPQTGKQVVMHTPEDLKNALVLGFKKVKEGSTQPTPEEISMIQAAGYKGKELQASLDAYNKANPKVQGVQQTYDPNTGQTTYADGRVEQSTAPRTGIQEVYSFKNLTDADLTPDKLAAIKSSGIGKNLSYLINNFESTPTSAPGYAQYKRNLLDALNANATAASRLTEKMNDVIANGYKPGTEQYESRLKEYSNFYNQLPDFMKVGNAAPREITTSSIQQPNSMASAGQATTPDQEAALAAKKTIESGTGSMGRKWGESRPGERYPQVEGPGNPSWEARNPDKNPNKDIGGTRENFLGKTPTTFKTNSGQVITGTQNQYGEFIPDTMPAPGTSLYNELKNNQGTIQSPTQGTSTSQYNIPFAPNLNDLQKQSINNLVGKGTAFNQNDAANFAYSIGLTDPSRFVGLTGQQALALLPAIQKSPTSITEITADTPRYQLKTITSNIAQTQGTTPATSQFIDATFQALHGRKANAGELSKFANQPSSKVYADILAGVPKVKTGDLNSMVDKISTSDPRLDVASGSGEVISKGGTPGDLLAQYGDKLAQLGFTELDKLLMNFQQGQLADIKGKLPGARQEEDALKSEYEKLKTTNYLESRARELFQGGTIQDLFDFLAANRKRLENEITSRDLGLSGIGNQPIASEIILGQKRVLQEQATARIGAINASSEAAMGELDRAIQTSDRVMSAIKEDRKNQIDALENLLDMAREDRISLEDDEKEAIEAEIEIIKDANERLAAEKEDMKKLVVDNPLVAAAAGVSFTDTYEEALNKILTAAQNPSSEVSMLLKKTSKTGSGGTGGGSGGEAGVRNIDVYVKQIQDENGVISYVPNMELLGALPDKEFSAKLEAATLRAAELTNEELANPTMSMANASDYQAPEKTETMTNKVLGAIDEAAGGWVDAAKNVWNWLND